MKLIPADKMPLAFKNLFNIYAHELSEYNPWLGTQIDTEGNYLAEIVDGYIRGGEKQAYVILDAKSALPAGLAVFSSYEEDGESFYDIEEIFVVKTSRKSGICKKICADFWSAGSGTGTLYVLKNNLHAVKYWERLLEESGYIYTKTEENEQMLLYKFKLK